MEEAFLNAKPTVKQKNKVGVKHVKQQLIMKLVGVVLLMSVIIIYLD